MTLTAEAQRVRADLITRHQAADREARDAKREEARHRRRAQRARQDARALEEQARRLGFELVVSRP